MVEWIAAYGLAPSILIFVVGLIMGSFLNVCICRMPEGESIVHPPSHCPICKRRLQPAELIPIFSWLVQRGRCKGCKTPISIRYPLTELDQQSLFRPVTKWNTTIDLASQIPGAVRNAFRAMTTGKPVRSCT